MSDSKKLSVELNSELESILSTPDENNEVSNYLKNYIRKMFIRRYFKLCLIVIVSIAILCASIYYIPFVNWNASAVGRLALINFVLPYYNWQHLYNSRCLVERLKDEKVDYGTYKGNSAISKDDCATCESLENLDRIESTTYGHLHSVYLSRDIPVIITDSHSAWPNQPSVPANFLDFLTSHSDLKYSQPCNIGTNLLQHRHHSPTLHHLLRQGAKIASNWFLHFRNCDFDSVKASRLIFPTKNRPYYLSSHLPPFDSSWIILSQQYSSSAEKQLPVNNLIVVLQLSGQISGRLSARNECVDTCHDQTFQLNEGEALLFNAGMWDFYYRNIDLHVNLTITVLHEIKSDSM